MSQINYGDYETISKAHAVAMERGWIARIGFDQASGQYWIEYIGKATR